MVRELTKKKKKKIIIIIMHLVRFLACLPAQKANSSAILAHIT